MRLLLAALLALSGPISQALAQDFSLTIKDHKFDPAELQVPAGKEFTLNVTNGDATAEEFESDDVDVEKVIAGGQSATDHARTARPGTLRILRRVSRGHRQGHSRREIKCSAH